MKIILLLSFAFSLTNCWWDQGHMLVAQIAKNLLIQENRTIFETAERITNILNKNSHGKISDFVESACYPDDVKGHGLTILDNFHFIDVPVYLPYNNTAEQIVSAPYDALSFLVSLQFFNFSLFRELV